MEEKERILQENYQEYFELGEQAFQSGKYNSAVTLFFKAISAAADLFLFKREGSVPSSHGNRFRIAQQKYPVVYDILDKDFPFYQDSYTNRMDREAAEVLREDAQRLKEMVR